MTLASVDQCSEATARQLTDQLRQSLSISWELLVEAYQRRAWAALGYRSWDAYTDAELGEVRLRLPREERREVVASMTEAGMSTRAIGAALGVHQETVVNDRKANGNRSPADEVVDAELVDEPKPNESGPLHDAPRDELGDRVARELAAADGAFAEQAVRPGPEPNAAPRVQGVDGKTYPAAPTKPAAPRRRALTQVFWEATFDLGKHIERITRLANDDRFPHNANEVATAHRDDLVRARDALQGVIDRLPTA